jgi:hypothetical protein
MHRAEPMTIASCNGLQLANALRSTRHKEDLPSRFIFFGVEANCSDRGVHFNSIAEDRLPSLTKKLSFLVGKIIEAVQNDAPSDL